MAEPIHEIQLRVVQQLTFKIPHQDRTIAIDLAKAAVNTLSHYRVQDQEFPVADQYVEGIQIMSAEEKHS